MEKSPLDEWQALLEDLGIDELERWAQEHLSLVDLGDARRNDRLVQLLAGMLQRPGKTLPEQCGSPAPVKAAYRLLQCEQLEHEAIVRSSAAATVEQLQGRHLQGTLLCIQDTTSLDFSSHHALQGRGPLSNKPSVRGFFAHSSLLVGAQGVMHGVLECEVYARDEAAQKARKMGERNRQSTRQKESSRWLRSLEQSALLCDHLPEVQTILNIADREADMYELFLEARRLGKEHAGKLQVLIRAQHDRAIQGEGRRLWEHLAGQPAQVCWSVKVPTGKGLHGTQQRQVEALWQKVRMEAPAHQRKYHGASEPLELSVILVREPQPPDKQPALEWVLLSTMEITDAAQARQMVDWYALRWQIEVLHRIWKSGCKVEQRRFQQARAAQVMIVLDLLGAVMIMSLLSQARHDPESSSDTWLNATQQQLLRTHFESSKTGTAGTPLSLAQAVRWIAQLGGHRGAPSSPPPGAEALWRGLCRLQDLQTGWLLAQLSNKCG